MPRAIVYATTPAGTRGGLGAPPADDYSDRILKLIPAEVIGVYVSMVTVAKSDDGLPLLVPWLVFLFGLLATYFYSRVALKVTDNRQLFLTVGAFSVWALTIGAPFDQLSWYRLSYGAMILPAYTFVVPMIMREQRQ
jgi:hypothetical protein